ncbi:NAD(P)-dependent oxidoreductase [Brachybacterium timonense]|uniref:NAD(P)-dependent oxidoreductase n=1 Tax=Brachybacterium timonense TaxID=2050896 RepID=UPI000D0BD9E3|nr:NAD(P)-dependent oxidoreductase [Brachybacterium timonense]
MTSTDPRRTRAVVGLGQMGKGIAASFVRAGYHVLGVDPGPVPTPEGVDRVEATHAIADAPVVVLSLPGSAQVDELVPLIEAQKQPRIIIDASTCPPDDTRQRAKRLHEAGHLLVDAPVSGGPSGAAAGALTAFLGCPAERLEEVVDALEPITTTVHHVGDTGAGNTAKLLNNLLCATHLSIAQTLLACAADAKIDPARLLDAINGASGRSAVTEVNLPRWVLSGSFDSGFPVGLMARDVDLALDLAEESGSSSDVARATAAMWHELLERTGPRDDFNRMVEQA